MFKDNEILICIVALVREFCNFVGWVFGIFLSAIELTGDSNEHHSLVEYGVLNYRTEKLDDGTDPYGWYG